MEQKILIATTNQGKFKEIKHFLDDLPFKLVNINNLEKSVPEPDEPEPTIEGNAILKAKYYAEKTGLISLADDGGLFVDALDGWPGVISAKIENSNDTRNQLILEKMKNFKGEDRKAFFKAALALYDPSTKNLFVSFGETEGNILEEIPTEFGNGFGYDPIFYVPEIGKTYAQMTVAEKNSVSHRGKALIKMKYHIQNTYGARHIMVGCAVIVKDGKILMARRNDPYNPHYHKKWEFPGGIVDAGESIEDAIKKEAQEEAGYDVEPVKMLNYIAEVEGEGDAKHCQIYLASWVCKVVEGKGKFSDAEVLELKWFDVDEAAEEKMLPGNKQIFNNILPELKQVIKEYNL